MEFPVEFSKTRMKLNYLDCVGKITPLLLSKMSKAWGSRFSYSEDRPLFIDF